MIRLMRWLVGTSPIFEARCRRVAWQAAARADVRERELLRAFALVERDLSRFERTLRELTS